MSKVKIAGHASGSGTLTIQAPDTSSSRTITLPDSTDTLIGAATTDALTTRINATGGRKNMVINGAMQVSQRGTSFAAIGNGDYSLDRWGNSNANIGVYTVTQDSDAPDGFANSYKVDCTTADASPTGADYLFIFQKIEGQDLQCWKKGTASAESITLSFWVKSNKTGDIQTNLYDTDNTRIIGNTITINSAGTWEQKSLTFAGDTTGAFTNDTNDSLKIEWWLDAGSSYSSGSVPTSWEAVATGDRAAGTTLALADSTSNYLNITGVQLELGTAATDFEYRSYGEELALCQRYYERFVADASVEMLIGIGFNYSATTVFTNYPFKQVKRVIPTFTSSGASHFERLTPSVGWEAASTISAVANLVSARLNIANFASQTAGDATEVRITTAAAGAHWFAYDAELQEINMVEYEMSITNAQYYQDGIEDINKVINATIDGEEMCVPLDPANRHYAEILKQVDEGTITIEEAD